MQQKGKDKLSTLFQETFKEVPSSMERLPISGSSRTYYRIKSLNHQVLGTYNTDLRENEAFLSFSAQLQDAGCSVPQIYAVGESKDNYLQQDLGDLTLFSYLSSLRASKEEFPDELLEVYKRIITQLIHLQLNAPQYIDWSVCYPRAAFDTQSMMWDLNYCKYYFFKLAQITFDEQALENDFQALCKFLLSVPHEYFLFRDFQSRNIMLANKEIFFIDYQGGRKGALHYDLASLLYDAKAEIPHVIREQLLKFYIQELQQHIDVDAEAFTKHYYGYVFIRIMQAMGAYGFRGFYEKKSHFLKSIPIAIDNISFLLKKVGLPIELPELQRILSLLPESEILKAITHQEATLHILVSSFAYKNAYPEDPSPNGGGFVFDCRAVHNPGRYETYKHLSGNDHEVIRYIEEHTDMNVLLEHAFALADFNIKTYLKRGFTHLAISFGCTGGQHRSVYAANRMAEYLQAKYPVQVKLVHREQAHWVQRKDT